MSKYKTEFDRAVGPYHAQIIIEYVGWLEDRLEWTEERLDKARAERDRYKRERDELIKLYTELYKRYPHSEWITGPLKDTITRIEEADHE